MSWYYWGNPTWKPQSCPSSHTHPLHLQQPYITSHLPLSPVKSHVSQPTTQISEWAAHQQISCLPKATKQQNISHISRWALDPILLLNSVASSRQKSTRETSMLRAHTCTDAHSVPEKNIQMGISGIIHVVMQTVLFLASYSLCWLTGGD